MEMPLSGLSSKEAQPLEAITLSREKIECEMLLRALGNPFVNRLPTFLPLFVLACAALGLTAKEWLLALVSFQILLMACTSYSANIVKQALADERSTLDTTGKALPIWIFFEMMAGLVWGLMIGPTAESGVVSAATTTASVTIIVTMALAVVVAASAPLLSKSLLIGFAISAVPTTIYHYEHFGFYTLLAVCLFPPTMFWLADRLGNSAYLSLKAEMENEILNERLTEALAISEYLSAHDSLTGLLNRRDFERAVEDIRAHSRVKNMTIIMVDLDHFKKINDQFGHAIGDEVLQTAAKIMRNQLRSTGASLADENIIARWGGEEFIIAIAGCNKDQISNIAESIRYALDNYDNDQWPEGLKLSGSLGTTCWKAGEPLNAAVSRADQAMYRAKAAGRNQTEALSAV